MPKTNHNRQFADERDYTVPEGDWFCGKHGAANERRGAKKGITRVNRTRQNQAVHNAVKKDEIEEFLPDKEFKTVKKAHDYEGNSKYVRY